MFGEKDRNSNFTDAFRHAIRESLGTGPSPEEIFYYVYAVLHSPTYRRHYEEFLKIDFPRIPLPTDYEVFKALSNLGRELVDLHLLKHLALQGTEVGFPKAGSYKVDYVRYVEAAQRVHINKDQCFEGITKEIWEYRIGDYQVMEKYLKDRRERKLSLDETNHYMKVAKAIRLTIGLQWTVDEVYAKID
jgi:predicted helicase